MRYLCGACTNMLPPPRYSSKRPLTFYHIVNSMSLTGCAKKKQEQDRFLFFMYIYTSPQNNKPHMDYPWLSDIGSPKEPPAR